MGGFQGTGGWLVVCLYLKKENMVALVGDHMHICTAHIANFGAKKLGICIEGLWVLRGLGINVYSRGLQRYNDC
jgi:hypothetical protein